ncbi:MAG: aminotransferase class V-fold PLP-dependent enzyme [Longimicrobiales bacterium]|nr:aminotransferase class V-fold PLP-dependent enzyme [Longimicrobiales bacterium]
MNRARSDAAPSTAPDDVFFRELRGREFARLARSGHAYLDYTGSGLYGESQVERHRDWLLGNVLGNPHSENPASLASEQTVERVRERLFRIFDADPAAYDLVFTSNASGALKLVGEAFPFAPGSVFALAVDNHNSVGGMRSWARRRGASERLLPLTRELRLDDPLAHLGRAGTAPSLVAFPAQSNFSGVKHPLDLVSAARERGFRVLLDTAAYVPTNPFSMNEAGADFACVSFYKMFGFPTGLGALLARREALEALERPWYAGGAVDFVSIQNDVHQLREAGGAFEDGTPDFLGVGALEAGLDLLEAVGMVRLRRWLGGITARLLEALAGLRHPDGAPAVAVYGPADTADRGGTVAFNLLDRAGRPLPYEAVEGAAARAGVSIRGGCFCNPGAAEVAFDMPARETLECLQRLGRDFTLARFRECLGGDVPVGAVRASLGIASEPQDVARLMAVLEGVIEGVPEGVAE